MSDARGTPPTSAAERALRRLEGRVSKLFEGLNERVDKVEARVDLGQTDIKRQLESMFQEQRMILGETRDAFHKELEPIRDRLGALERKNEVEDEVRALLKERQNEQAAQRGATVALETQRKRPSWTLATALSAVAVLVSVVINLPAIIQNVAKLLWKGWSAFFLSK